MGDFVASLNAVLWSTPVIYILLGIGLVFSIMTRFLQVRHLKEMIVLMFQERALKPAFLLFKHYRLRCPAEWEQETLRVWRQRLHSADPAQCSGCGRLPLSVFASAFVESTLAQIYKVKQGGQYRGAPLII